MRNKRTQLKLNQNVATIFCKIRFIPDHDCGYCVMGLLLRFALPCLLLQIYCNIIFLLGSFVSLGIRVSSKRTVRFCWSHCQEKTK